MGYYVPENIVTNEDLSKMMDTDDSWIQERTGIKERRWIKEGTDDTSATMGVKAAKIAIERAGLTKDNIDFGPEGDLAKAVVFAIENKF